MRLLRSWRGTPARPLTRRRRRLRPPEAVLDRRMKVGILRTRGMRFRRDDGQAAFEFVLMLPFFIMFVLLLVDFGILTYEYVTVSNAVREGARYASVNCPVSAAPTAGPGCQGTNEVRDRVIARSANFLSATDTYQIGWVDTLAPANNYDRGDTV